MSIALRCGKTEAAEMLRSTAEKIAADSASGVRQHFPTPSSPPVFFVSWHSHAVTSAPAPAQVTEELEDDPVERDLQNFHSWPSEVLLPQHAHKLKKHNVVGGSLPVPDCVLYNIPAGL